MTWLQEPKRILIGRALIQETYILHDIAVNVWQNSYLVKCSSSSACLMSSTALLKTVGEKDEKGTPRVRCVGLGWPNIPQNMPKTRSKSSWIQLV